MLYPLTFEPIFQERIWGGRNLETLFGKRLPPGKVIGESWEISDRPEANSVINNGPLAGTSLAALLAAEHDAVMGRARTLDGRFPLLIKLLDAQDNLSLQVHPPASLAGKMGGCPKTEMWYVAAAEQGACLYAGLKRGVTREEFAKKTADGTVADCFHQIPVQAGCSLFLPSGRVHALGKGIVIFEIQENSDTTYRVFDWNRVDAKGKSRDLHVDESLKCIDFADFEPPLTEVRFKDAAPGVRIAPLVRHALFGVNRVEMESRARLVETIHEPRIVAVVSGIVEIPHPAHRVKLTSGQFALIPASLGEMVLEATTNATVLTASPG
jgi:mannose-6-phosphate isomerase